jgi:hypothetical protein
LPVSCSCAATSSASNMRCTSTAQQQQSVDSSSSSSKGLWHAPVSKQLWDLHACCYHCITYDQHCPMQVLVHGNAGAPNSVLQATRAVQATTADASVGGAHHSRLCSQGCCCLEQPPEGPPCGASCPELTAACLQADKQTNTTRQAHRCLAHALTSTMF